MEKPKRRMAGARIPNYQVWEDFKKHVQNKHGKTHQTTGEELQKVLEKHLQDTGFYDEPENDDDTIPPDQDQRYPPTPQQSTNMLSITPQVAEPYGQVVAELSKAPFVKKEEVYKVITQKLDVRSDKGRLSHYKSMRLLGLFREYKPRKHEYATEAPGKVVVLNPDFITDPEARNHRYVQEAYHELNPMHR